MPMMGFITVIMLCDESESSKSVDFELIKRECILGGPHITELQPLKGVRDLKRQVFLLLALKKKTPML